MTDQGLRKGNKPQGAVTQYDSVLWKLVINLKQSKKVKIGALSPTISSSYEYVRPLF